MIKWAINRFRIKITDNYLILLRDRSLSIDIRYRYLSVVFELIVPRLNNTYLYTVIEYFPYIYVHISRLEIIIFQWSDMLSDYARIYIVLVSRQSINFSISDNKNIVKISASCSKVLNWLFTCGHDSAITLTPKHWTLNTDNINSIKQSFCDTGTLGKQKLLLSVPITPPDIYIKI